MFNKNYEKRVGNIIYSRKKDIEYSKILQNFEPTFVNRIKNCDSSRLKKIYRHFLDGYYYFNCKIADGTHEIITFSHDTKKEYIIANKIKLLIVCIIPELINRILNYENNNDSLQDFTGEECNELKISINSFLESNNLSYNRDLLEIAYQDYYDEFIIIRENDFYDNTNI